MKAPNQRGIQGVKYPYYFEAFVKPHTRDLREIPDHPIVLYYSFFMHTIKTLAHDFDANSQLPPVLHIKQQNSEICRQRP